jgi:hypothetical protein
MLQSLIRALIRESLLLEDKIQDLVDSDASGSLQDARDQGITNIAGLMWLKAMIDQRKVGPGAEPVEDVIPTILAFFKQGVADRLKKANYPTDIMRYKNPGELRMAIGALGTSRGEQERTIKTTQTSVVYESPNFLVVMPHTTDSACYYGKGTTWCTAATTGANLFLSYVGSNRGIILYHILKMGGDSRVDPYAKINLATVKGEPHFSAQMGGLSVDAKNNGLTRQKFDEALGDEADDILEAIIQHAASVGEHPAKKEVDASVQNLAAWKKATAKLGKDEFSYYMYSSLKDRPAAKEVLLDALSDPRTKAYDKKVVYGNENFDDDMLLQALEGAKDFYQPEDSALAYGAVYKKNTTTDFLFKASEIFSTKKNGKVFVEMIYQNPAFSGEQLVELYKNPASAGAIPVKMAELIARNPNLPPELFESQIGPALRGDQKAQMLIKTAMAFDGANDNRNGFIRMVWNRTKDSLQSYFGDDILKTIAMWCTEEDVLNDVADFFLRIGPWRGGHSITRELLTNSLLSDENVKRFANGDDRFGVMLALARIEDPEFDADAVEDEFRRTEGDDGRDYDDDY